MDWLKKLGGFLGGVSNQAGRTIGNVFGGANQAVQQAQRTFAQPVQRVINQFVPPPRPVQPKPQLPKVQIPQFQLPQAPKINLNDFLRAINQQGQGAATGANMAYRTITGQQLAPNQQQMVRQSPQLNQALSLGKPLAQIPKFINDVSLRGRDIQQQRLQQIKENPATYIAQNFLGPLNIATQASDVSKLYSGRDIVPKLDTTKIVQDTSNVLARSPLKNIPGAGVVSDIVNPIAKQIARGTDVLQNQEQYSKGLKGMGEFGSDLATVISLFYAGGLSKQLATKGTAFLPTAARLAPRLAASGAGQNILQQLSEGKKINEIDPKQVAAAAALYTGLGVGIPGATRGAGAITSKLFGKAQPNIPLSAPQVTRTIGNDYTGPLSKMEPPKLPQVGKTTQFETIKKLNPMTDEYHTGIRSVDDIKTYQEAFNDPESFVYPDYSKVDAKKALDSGKVTVYSSKPLDSNNAQFVTPSKMQASDYAGNGKVYSKEVNINDVAWINGDEGQLTGSGTSAPIAQVGKTIANDVPQSYLQPKAPKVPIKASELPVVAGEKTRGFTKSVQTSPEVSPEFAKLASGTYEGVTKKQTLANTQKLFEGKDINAVQTDIMTRVNSKKAPDAQTISDTIALMKNYDAAGNHEAANAIQQQIAEKLTQSGQTVWAASLLHNRTPEGVLYGARRALNTAGVDITPELEKSLQGAISKIRTTKGADKDMAIKEMQRLVAQQIPSSFGEKAVALWKAGLLTGIKTQTGNATSNISSIALKKSSDPAAALIDATLGLVTGERTKTATLRGLFSGTKEGFKKAGTFMKTGIDERTGITNKFDLKLVNYGKSLPGKAAQGYTDFVFKLMGAADRPYYYATLRNNLNDIAIAQAKNGGFKGAERATFIKKFVDTPPEYALQTAIDAAEKSIFANDTLLSGLASGLKTKAGKFEPVVDAIMPFTKVPSAVITRVFDYTPAGAVKTVAKQIASGKLDQRALSEGLAEAGTGTAAIWMGYQLSQAGLMTGPYPKDPKERDLWVLEGKQPYSIRVGDKWLSMNYTSPIGQVLAIGDDMSIAQKNGESFSGQVVAGALGGAKAVVSQSFLQGTSALLDAVNDPQRSADKYLKQQVASIVPTLANDIAKATDPLQREANTAYEAVIARIPFLSKTLNPKRDVFGNPVQQKSPNALDTLINPFRPSQIPTPTDLGNELRRLQDEKLGTLPDISGKDFFGKNTTVDKSQINKIQSELGPQIQTAWSKAIKDPRYSKLTDDEKKRVLDKIKSDITAAYKAGNAQNYGQTWTGTLTKDQQNIYGGQEAGLSVPGQPKPPKIKISKPKKVSKGRAATKGRAPAKGRATSFKIPKFKKVSARKAPASPKAPKVGKVKRFAKFRPTKSARKTIKIKA